MATSSSENSDCVLVLTTLPSDHDAAAVANALVAAGVAACVTVTPGVESTYRWQGAIERSREHQLAMKTTRARIGDLWTALRAHHPYDVPEFIVLPIVGGNRAYLAWIEESVTPTPA